MKERPILFSAPMVRAILSGSKSQTRRVVKMKPHHQIEERDNGTPWPWMYDGERDADSWMACPYGQPGGDQQGVMQPATCSACAGRGAIVHSGNRVGGDRLYVRETWSAPHAYDHLPPRLIPKDARIHYAATEDRGGLLWRPSIHMPRWASRITLEVTSVRVERLQDISEADAQAEGWTRRPEVSTDPQVHKEAARDWFMDLWESINGHGSWDANPWVWVVEFRSVEVAAK